MPDIRYTLNSLALLIINANLKNNHSYNIQNQSIYKLAGNL